MVGTWSATMSKLLHHEAIVCGWGSCQHVPWRETACSSYSDGTETRHAGTPWSSRWRYPKQSSRA